jgi:hypothetical protein
LRKRKNPCKTLGFCSRHSTILEGTRNVVGFLGRNHVKLKGGKIKAGLSNHIKKIRYMPESRMLHIFNAGCRQEFFCINDNESENETSIENIIRNLKKSFPNFEVYIGSNIILTKKEEGGVRKKIFVNYITEIGELAHKLAKEYSSTKAGLIAELFDILNNPNYPNEEKNNTLHEIIEGLCASKDEKIFTELDNVTHFLTSYATNEKAKETIRCELLSSFNSLLGTKAIERITAAIDMLVNPEILAYDILEAELIKCLELINLKYTEIKSLPCNISDLENRIESKKLEIASLVEQANELDTKAQKNKKDVIIFLNDDKDDEVYALMEVRREIKEKSCEIEKDICTKKLELETISKQLHDIKANPAIKSDILLLEMKINSYANTLRLIKGEATLEDITRQINKKSNLTQSTRTELIADKKSLNEDHINYDLNKIFQAFNQLKYHGLFPGIGNNLKKLYEKTCNSEILETAYNGLDKLRQLFKDKGIANPSVETIIKSLKKNRLLDENCCVDLETAVNYLKKRKAI